MSERLTEPLPKAGLVVAHVASNQRWFVWSTEDHPRPTILKGFWGQNMTAAYSKWAGGDVESAPHSLDSVASLAERVTKLERAQQVLRIPVSTFAPKPYAVVQPFEIVVDLQDGEYVATFFDANISSSGENPTEAYANAKEMVVALFEMFSEMDAETFGPEPQRQWAVLRQVMQRSGD